MTAYGHYFDKATKEIHSSKVPVDLDDRGLGYVLFHSMKQSAADGLTAQIDAATGHHDSFKCFLSRCIRLAISMQNIGIKRGDIVSICSYNHLNSAVPYLAGHFIGATLAPTDPSMSLDDQKHLLNLVKPKIIFVCNGTEDLIVRALTSLNFKCQVITFARNKCNEYRTFTSMIEKQELEDTFEPVISEDPTATCVILFSSGTTGLAKGICLNHYMIMSIFSSVQSLKLLRPRCMLYSSLYWISAVGFQTICFFFGLERVVCTHYDAQLMWMYMVKYQVQFAFLAPIQAIKGIEYLHSSLDNQLALKVLVMGGSTIAPNYLQHLRDLLPKTLVVSGYGQTEIGFISMFQKVDTNYTKMASVGFLTTNYIAKIVNPDTEEALNLGGEGEIRIKIPYPMNGYYNQDSSSVWDEEGFIRTGDLGYFDEDLCLFLTDRIKEMFKYQSWHIVPAKLEAILQSYPDVELAIVVGIPHSVDDNHAAGGVTLMTKATVTVNELEQYVEERVDERNRLRAGIVVLDQMPLTPTGKIMRRKAKEMLQNMINVSS